MKKAWRKICEHELLCDFIMCGLIIFTGGGFLLYIIIKIVGDSVFLAKDIGVIGFSAAVVFAVILLSGVSLYKLSTSYIRCYKRILDSIPTPVIVTDKDAGLQQVNEAAREVLELQQRGSLEKLNCRHLISADGGVIEKTWVNNETAYRVTGSRLCYGGKDEGYLIVLNNVHGVSKRCETRDELLDEINRLLGRLSTANNHIHDCANNLSNYTVQQVCIITELSDAIVQIASGTLNEPDALNEKICTVKADILRHVESGQLQVERIRHTALELDAARDSFGGVLRDIDSVP